MSESIKGEDKKLHFENTDQDRMELDHEDIQTDTNSLVKETIDAQVSEYEDFGDANDSIIDQNDVKTNQGEVQKDTNRPENKLVDDVNQSLSNMKTNDNQSINTIGNEAFKEILKSSDEGDQLPNDDGVNLNEEPDKVLMAGDYITDNIGGESLEEDHESNLANIKNEETPNATILDVNREEHFNEELEKEDSNLLAIEINNQHAFHDIQDNDSINTKGENNAGDDINTNLSLTATPEKDDVEYSNQENQTTNLTPQLPPRKGSMSLDSSNLTKVAPGPSSPPLPSRNRVAVPVSNNVGIKNAVHNVPPTLETEMQSEAFRKNLGFTNADVIPPKLPSRNHSKNTSIISSAAEINLIVDRFRKTSHNFQNENDVSKENLKEGRCILRSSYSTLVERLVSDSTATNNELASKTESEKSDQEENIMEIDWNFWSEVVDDFSKVTRDDPDKLEKMITDGIPPQIRGIIWQLISNSKSKEFTEIYSSLINLESVHEAAIRRDIRRTNFIPEDKTESLFSVMKAYSLYDKEVGYTQGMAFIVAPLLLNCESEADTFGLLIRLMNNYELRELFLPGMPGLMLMLYQFDRLIEESSPQLYNYLTRQSIRSTMYATQWFLTFFAYRFPLGFVIRIFDIVFVEGIEAILKFAVILMLKNEDHILSLKFEQLLDFLKTELFHYYSYESINERAAMSTKNNNSIDSNNSTDDVYDSDKADAQSVVQNELKMVPSSHSTIKRTVTKTIRDSEYDTDLFVHDAMNEVHITPISLQRYSNEYKDIHELEQQKEQQYEHMRIKNHQLHREVKKLEHDYTQLNREHVSIANELINNRLKNETLIDENNDLRLTVLTLKRQLEEEVRKQSLPNPDAALPNDLKYDLEQAMNRNREVMTENMKLQDKIGDLENYIERLKAIRYPKSPSKDSNSNPVEPASPPSGGWSGFKKVFAKPTS
ncbi:hypothetical protein TPHA_0H02000 [Tetrapisispora phaffii CBS 4417]|uniref:GTPase-activating protein GYP5 n=1 Tax=Tetrapisispora phaffii (strain ATCC 24235 / CBS 4417 / NBRC 1672 / NRRL Y-8282 / UCD 70-5) TaxID=1071381 RepID=G8BWF3_TETPH|nr:hypothetical protein TPHA_0H02000 [Tetrapisispora phaffii CBS 4417]CCE64404.1 hypothetical protein TPHA_0H02000 [Tetrapisispora phaffii CBS 4417]